MTYMDQREKVSQYTLSERYTTNDIIDLSELYVLKQGIKGSYFPEGVYPTFTWYVNGSKEPLEEGKDYSVTEPAIPIVLLLLRHILIIRIITLLIVLRM